MPWALFNRPSIQLGTLKAYIESNSSRLEVETAHPYLEVASILGTELYHWISKNVWVCESLYAPLIFPEQKRAAEKLATSYKRKAGSEIKTAFNFNKIHEQLRKHLKKWVNGCDWSQYKIIGFSVCFHQLLASLAAAHLIKEKAPHSTIVFGGSSCAGDAGKSLLDNFSFLDFIINGEGEISLLELCTYISKKDANLSKNIFSRKSIPGVDEPGSVSENSQLASLAPLPLPDYSDYFSEQEKYFTEMPFIPVLPVEFSRGCWWNKCTFCNLNLQWCGYRFKKSAQMLNEVTELSTRHRCLDFTFTDNMLPPKESLRFFSQLDKVQADLNFFAEIRPLNTEMELDNILATYRRGGLSTIQVGIESFSNSLLEKMRKGVHVIENIATMKAAQEQALKLEGNLIIQFPGSTQAEMHETLENLDFVFPYSPLNCAVFFLGHDSPIHSSPDEFGIRTITNHVNSRKLFPKEILQKLHLIVKDYRGDKNFQKKLWQPVYTKVKEWQMYHEKRNASALHKPLLYYRDGGDFLLIRQELIDGTVLNHRLQGSSRQIYLYCTHIKTSETLFRKFPSISRQKIIAFLADLRKKRLIFSDGNRHLALAVHGKYY